MPLSTLDPKPALVVIDLQQGIAALPTTRPAAEVVAAAQPLLRAFRARSLPVVLVNVGGTPKGRSEKGRVIPQFPAEFTQLLGGLEAVDSDIRVTKKSWGAFTGTDLDQKLKDAGVTQVVVLGISTSIEVESTARQAHELGYNVVVVTDAIADTDKDAEENSLTRIFPRLGETCSAQDLLDKLA